jgi:S1-C subfamily serine protease
MRTVARKIMLVSSLCMAFSFGILAEDGIQAKELEGIGYEQITNVSPDEHRTFGNLAQVGHFLDAYQRGKAAIATYKEPILTRGSRGITLFRQASPGVVLVTVGRVVQNEYQPSGIGTGAIVDSRGYVITNWHVIEGFRDALLFLKPFGDSELSDDLAFVARVLAQDPTRDLALLKIVSPAANLTVLPISSSTAVDVAQDVHVIGHPKGNFWSYSTGVVSQFRRAYEWSYSDGSHHRANVLQMQTAINPGNSGGPVFDDSGQIVGLVAMSQEGQNLNYAISADEIRTFLAIHLPPRTRGTQAVTRYELPRFTYAIGAVGEKRILRAEGASSIIYLVKSNHSWQALVKTKGQEIRILPQNSEDGERWAITSPVGLIAELEEGALTRLHM